VVAAVVIVIAETLVVDMAVIEIEETMVVDMVVIEIAERLVVDMVDRAVVPLVVVVVADIRIGNSMEVIGQRSSNSMEVSLRDDMVAVVDIIDHKTQTVTICRGPNSDVHSIIKIERRPAQTQLAAPPSLPLPNRLPLLQPNDRGF